MFTVGNFSNLSTEKFRKKLLPKAIEIYQAVWPGCQIDDLRSDGVKVHLLDKEFGIDMVSTLKSGQFISVQEKYRNYYLWSKYKDFTQEYLNGAGTQYESPGEWFHLGAQIYFVGWVNKQESDFQHWFMLDILKYKLLVEQYGGLNQIGNLRFNSKHGKASFYCIPINYLLPAFLMKAVNWPENKQIIKCESS